MILVRSFLFFQSMKCLNVKKGLNGLTFSLPPKYLEYGDYLVNFEWLYRNIRNLGILSNEDPDFVKQEQKKQPSLLIETILTMYRNIFLKKSFFLYKIYVKIKILLSRNLIRLARL